MPIQIDLIDELKKSVPVATPIKAPSPTKIKKRHWLLSSMVILVGSWITHTTTATISSSTSSQPERLSNSKSNLGDTELSSISVQSELSEEQDGILLSTENLEPTARKVHKVIKHSVTKGESLGHIFKKKGFDLAIPHHISKHSIAKKLTSIRIGKEIEFEFDEHDTMTRINYPLSALSKLRVDLNGVQVKDAWVEKVEFDTQVKTVSADINSSLYLAAQDAGLSVTLIMEMVRIFGWDVDFVQDIRVGDSFHIVHEELMENGTKLSDGNILAAEFTTQGRTYRAFRFEDELGTGSYFNEDGESMLGTFLRSPVEFSRISSRFGKRKHPISKKWKAHKGVDYAAARGTPIRATADGKVILAGRKGGYGKTVILRHAGRMTTLYAHMNGYAKGIKSGARVKQGQTIGYVGSTGMSTGPHLHYEFRLDGVHRNPLTFKTPKAAAVSAKNQERFNQLATTFGIKLDALKNSHQIAKRGTSTNTESL